MTNHVVVAVEAVVVEEAAVAGPTLPGGAFQKPQMVHGSQMADIHLHRQVHRLARPLEVLVALEALQERHRETEDSVSRPRPSQKSCVGTPRAWYAQTSRGDG